MLSAFSKNVKTPGPDKPEKSVESKNTHRRAQPGLPQAGAVPAGYVVVAPSAEQLEDIEDCHIAGVVPRELPTGKGLDEMGEAHKGKTELKSETPPAQSTLVVATPSNLGTGKGKRAARGGMSLPPTISLVYQVSIRRRFHATAAISSLTTINVGNLIGAAGVIAAAGTTAYAWCNAVRLKEVIIWPNVSTSPDASMPVLAFALGPNYKPVVRDSSVPAGCTIPKSLSFKPPKQSLAAFWCNFNSPSTVLFSVNDLGEGSIVDVLFDATMLDGVDGTTAYSPSVSAATAGKVYYLKLDGAGGLLSPPPAVPTLP